MEGRVCVVTGASSGIGRETAAALARRGARVVLVCRDPQRGEETRAALMAATKNPNIDVVLADLGSQAAIRKLAAALLGHYPRIQVLINNAGVLHLRRTTTVDGVETVFAVNHLAYFLLTNLLLDRLMASAPARVVNVSSDLHRWSRMSWDDLGGEKRYHPMRVYGQSKLANLLFTYELARRLTGTGVTVNAVHPGAVATRLGHNNGRIAALLARVLAPVLRSPAKGAEASLYAAVAPGLDGVSGKYFVNCKERRSSKESYDTEAARRLWELSARMTGLA
jgi:NAD(P)-dependent dehydrogenase (short-subunit alcohol dehydrogenase family)